jgi:glutamate carboxypeptidase
MTTNTAIDTSFHLGRIGDWVKLESPTDAPASVNAMIGHIESGLGACGITTERVPGRDGLGDHLLARIAGRRPGPGIFVVGHIDTVWPLGTLARLPFRVEGDRAFGPGIYDMKAGSYLAFAAVEHLVRSGIVPELPVTIVFNADEEIGSPTSRALIETEARNARFALVPEPGIGTSAVVTARKGVGRFQMQVRGRPAHSGANHDRGRSAVVELAKQILALEALTDYATGVTVNVGVVRGGTRSNVVPAYAEADIDMRAPTIAAGEDACAAILGRRPIGPDVTVTVEGGMNRPPFERTAAVVALYLTAKKLSADLGFELTETIRGGGSDGNFTAALGIPTLDGLGCCGDGAHAEDEHILVSSIPQRLALMTALLRTLS